jgi:hypothetical protein
MRRTPPPAARALSLFALFAVAGLHLPAHAQAWLMPGDRDVREAVERLVDERVLNLPLLSWPLPRAELHDALAAIRADESAGRRRLSAGQAAAVTRLEARLGEPRREWWVAAGDPTDLRGFADAPRESGELGAAARWGGTGVLSGELRARLVLDAADGQELRADGSYAAALTGNWIWSAGFVDRWWGAGQEGSLEFSTNARPVFSLSVDRASSQPFETRWLRWLGPWTIGTFIGALEGHRPDSNHALLWGARAAFRPLPGLEIGVSRNAQFCGDKPPCSLDAFWDVVFGNDNAGENVDAADEPGNQLATYELRWAGRLGRVPLGVYVQRTGETIDNDFPRPLRSLNLVSLSTWGESEDGDRWRAHIEASTTTCADLDDVEAPDCGYENGVFTAGYRYRGRVLGHSTDSDTRQYAAGLQLATPANWYLSATLRRAEVNRVGGTPQVNHLLAPNGPELWWLGEGAVTGPLGGGEISASFGLQHRRVEASGATDLDPVGYLRWTQRF